MDEDDDGLDEGTKKTRNPLYVLKKEEFIGKTAYESYMHYHHGKSSSSKEEYFRLCRTIEHGKELLPTEVDAEDVDSVNQLYSDANMALETEVPKQVTMNYGWIDPTSKNFPVIQLLAGDSGIFSFPPELLDKSGDSFRETQYSNHIGKLREIDNKIYRFLIKYRIISKTPPLDDLMDEQLKQDFLTDSEQERKDAVDS